MKIGIITIQKSPASYGALLQAFALWKYIDDKGDCSAEIIDLYRPAQNGYIHSVKRVGFLNYNYRLNKRNRVSPISWIKKYFNKRKTSRFLNFANKSKYSNPFYSVDSLYQSPPDYDVYISGSDQIWNPDMSFNVAPYFLEFVKDKKKISYASSFGKEQLDAKYLEQSKKWLSDYTAISVRESKTVELLGHLGIKSMMVLDPTFLLSSDDWKSISSKRKLNDKYIMFFSFTHSGRIKENIEYIAKKTNNKIVTNSKEKSNLYIDISRCPVEDWLSYILNATCIITDSFHAAVFSIIFNRPFYVFISSNSALGQRRMRIDNLLEITKLTQRKIGVDEIRTINIHDQIDYENVNKTIQPLILSSKEFLDHYL